MAFTRSTSILVIGTGTFGLSTAYHLAKRGYTNVTCIDKNPYPSVDSAGYDLNKIIRAEYEEPMYCDMGIEALEAWRQPLWDGIFHETGWITTTSGDPAMTKDLDMSYKNLVASGNASGIELVDTPEAIIRHVPHLKNAKGLETWKGIWNRNAGWVHARNALEKLGDEAKKLGVKFISGPAGTMTSLKQDDGKVLGINVASGDVLAASLYVLCTGAASSNVLPELSKQVWTRGWTFGHIQLAPQEMAEFKDMPVVDNFELGFVFEPDQETGLMKIAGASNTYQWNVGGLDGQGPYSIPRYASDHPEDGIPEAAMNAIKSLIDTLLPQFSGRPILGAKLCWCARTVDNHFLITRDPKFLGGELVLACGGSGHGFKFLPTIGGYIADCIEGNQRGLRQEWAWKENEGVVRPGGEGVVTDLRDVGLGNDHVMLSSQQKVNIGSSKVHGLSKL